MTTVTIPEFDAEFREQHNHYGHAIDAITPAQFKDHLADAALYNDGTTHLPDHEALLAIANAWPERGRGKPAWVKVTEADGLTPPGVAADIEKFLTEFYSCPTLEDHFNCDPHDAIIHKELGYFTLNGPPGECRNLVLPDLSMTYMQDGRIMNNLNDGGDTLMAAANSQGVGSAANTTTLTTTSTLVGTTNLPGHRIVVYTTSGNTFVYGNIVSNTSGANGVITVDQWYTPATPGGSAGATPGTPWAWMVVDGGFVSSWFCGIGTGTPTIANTDHSINTSNTEYTQSGTTGLSRKICPTATDVSSSARTVTLVPVFTALSSDVANLPKTFSLCAFYASIVVGFSQAGGPMKFETALSATATLAALNDQLTITETITGS